MSTIINTTNIEWPGIRCHPVASGSNTTAGKLSANRLVHLAPLIRNIFPLEEIPTREGLLVRRRNGKALRFITAGNDILDIGNIIGFGVAKEVREMTPLGVKKVESSKDFVYAERKRNITPYCKEAQDANRQIGSDLTIGRTILAEIRKIQANPESFSTEIQRGANCLVKVFGGKGNDEISCPCLLMERLNGADLKTHPTQFSEQQMAQFSYDTFCALALLHSIGIVHRDVKPENIFLTDGDTGAKLGDYGLSVTWEVDILTGHKVPAGTPVYYPPEYAKAYFRKLDKLKFQQATRALKFCRDKDEMQQILLTMKAYKEKRDTWAASLSYLLLIFNEKREPKWKQGKFSGIDEFFNYLQILTDSKIQKWGAYVPFTEEPRVFESEIGKQLVATLLEGLKINVSQRPSAEKMAQELGKLLTNRE